jgi:predicted DNA binding CopG/RHH family protein
MKIIKKKKLPHFNTSEEAAIFWDSHNLKEYIHDFESADELFVLSPALAQRIRERAKKRLISIRLAEWEIEKSKQIAKQRKMPYHALIRQWIDEGIRAAFTKLPRGKAA